MRLLLLVMAVATVVTGVPTPAAAAREPGLGAVVTVRDVTYRTAGRTALQLDVCMPAAGGPYRALILVHGGSWKSGDKRELVKQCRRAAAREGMVAFNVNYRLAPPGGTAHAPDPVEDLRAAIDWVRANAARYRVDGEKVSALGVSAGAHLVLRVATTTRELSSVASWSGRADLRDSPPGSSQENYVGCSYAACPARYKIESPLLWVNPGDVPTFLAHAQHDPIVPYDSATSLRDAFAAAGIPHDLISLDGSAHGSQLDGSAWDASMAFIRRY